MDINAELSQKPSQSRTLRTRAISLAALTLSLIALPLGIHADRAGGVSITMLSPVEAAVQWNELPMPEGSVDLARFYDRPFRTLTVDIPLSANDGDLEYKLQMNAGDAVVYSWRVLEIDNPEWFYTEFHGHTEPGPDGVGDLMFYRRETGSSDNGNFVAPFEGIHGWYLQNQSEQPVVVRLDVAGFFEEIPDQVPPVPAAQ
jgi:hypothetical protein